MLHDAVRSQPKTEFGPGPYPAAVLTNASFEWRNAIFSEAAQAVHTFTARVRGTLDQIAFDYHYGY